MSQDFIESIERLFQRSHSSSIDTGALEIGRSIGRLEEGVRRRERTVDYVLKIVIAIIGVLAGWFLRGLSSVSNVG